MSDKKPELISETSGARIAWAAMEQDSRSELSVRTGSGVALTAQENSVLEHLASAWNAFTELPTLHPDEQDEMRRAIHAAQHIIGTRVACRANPEVWNLHPNDGDRPRGK